MNRGLVVGFALGLGLTALALVGAPRARTLWAQARLSGVPGRNGVAISVETAPPGVSSAPAALVVWHENAGPLPVEVCWSEPPGGEFGFEVVPVAGGDPLPPAHGPEAPTIAGGATLRRTWLPPGGRVGVVCDLARFVALPGPGEYEVRAERVPCGDPRGGFDAVRCRSEPARVVVP